MHDPFVRILAILLAIAMGIGGFREMRRGVIRVRDSDGPTLWLNRRRRPFAYSLFVAFFFACLAAMVVGAILLP